MSAASELASFHFTALTIEWRGSAPFLFAPIPDAHSGEILFAARMASYGWGVVPVSATIGATRFGTSLIPRAGVFLLPIKIAVQKAEGIGVGVQVSPRLTIIARVS